MIAAAAHALAGHDAQAREWARNVRQRNPRLTRGDFFRAFPFRSQSTQARLEAALKSLGF
jgi:hypothetical protein